MVLNAIALALLQLLAPAGGGQFCILHGIFSRIIEGLWTYIFEARGIAE